MNTAAHSASAVIRAAGGSAGPPSVFVMADGTDPTDCSLPCSFTAGHKGRAPRPLSVAARRDGADGNATTPPHRAACPSVNPVTTMTCV
ncbi:hypothetical protein ALMP_01080 [Streptomyces sp. A012304]|nr:hypothetical protein ALMP_01080 [Streptomyces sp. A012304]